MQEEIVTGKELTPEVKKDVSLFVQNANALEIKTEDDLVFARDAIRAGRMLKDKISEWFKPLKTAAKAAHQALCDKEKVEINPIDEGMQIYTNKITEFQLAEQKRIDEENRRLEEEARKRKDAAEKKIKARIDALAEQCLSDNEKVVALQSDLNNPELTQDERDIIEARISSLIVSMDSTKQKISDGQAKLEAAAETPRPIPVQAQFKVKGIGKIKPVYIPEIRNPYVLLAAIARKEVPLSIVKFDEVKMKRLVNEGMALPGVITREEFKTSVR